MIRPFDVSPLEETTRPFSDCAKTIGGRLARTSTLLSGNNFRSADLIMLLQAEMDSEIVLGKATPAAALQAIRENAFC